MKTQTITANFLSTICWLDDTIADWAAGQQYTLDGEAKRLTKYHYPGRFDSAVSSEDGTYAFVYKRLGTKGLLLKNGELLREINRSYYCADSYEFPAAFITRESKTYLIHCPISYNQLDFEDVETGEIITNILNRKPDDIFHSRLEISPNGTFLMSKGWLWHPLEVINIYNLDECFKNPAFLDKPMLSPDVGAEVCTGSFITDEEILIGSSDEVLDDENIESLPPKHIAVWNLKTNQLSKPAAVKEEFGNLYAINKHLAWDLFNFPKIMNIATGEIIDQNNDIDSGKQRSSIINSDGNFPVIIFNRSTKQIAIKGKEKIEVLTP
jgi:hypothetical protein